MAMADHVPELHITLLDAGDPADAAQMAAYLKDHFPFAGVKTPQRRAIAKDVLGRTRPSPDELLEFAAACWDLPEREMQMVGADELRRHAGILGPEQLPAVRGLLTDRAWWDSVDVLAIHVVGPMVRGHRELQTEMDRWIDDRDLWVARTAILHQLLWKEETDTVRLETYLDRRADDRDFFIRKALGWALRQYARTDPDWVARVVDEHRHRLSGLTIREALKHLER